MIRRALNHSPRYRYRAPEAEPCLHYSRNCVAERGYTGAPYAFIGDKSASEDHALNYTSLFNALYLYLYAKLLRPFRGRYFIRVKEAVRCNRCNIFDILRETTALYYSFSLSLVSARHARFVLVSQGHPVFPDKTPVRTATAPA